MASTRQRQTKDGTIYFEIAVSRGRGVSAYTTRWYPQPEWSKKYMERELAKAAAQFENECKQGKILNREQRKAIADAEALERAKQPTLKEYAESVFLPVKKRTTTQSTYEFYEAKLRDYIYPVFEDIKITDITPNMCKSFFLELSNKVVGKGEHARTLSYSFQKGTYITLFGLLKMAYEDEIINRNPCLSKFRPCKPKDELKNSEVEFLDASEVARLEKCLEGEPLKWRALVYTMIDTGCRRGEVVAIKWSKIDFISGKIIIDSNIVKTDSGKVYEGTPKSHKSRNVFVRRETLNLLKELRVKQHDDDLVSNYVFTQDGMCSPMHPDSPSKYLRKFGDKHGFDNLHPHKLRHTWASLSLLNGSDVVSVSKALGHSDPTITLSIYSHSNDEAVRTASENLHNAIKAMEA